MTLQASATDEHISDVEHALLVIGKRRLQVLIVCFFEIFAVFIDVAEVDHRRCFLYPSIPFLS